MTTKKAQTEQKTLNDHLTLPCFPSCEDCLAWSDNTLAFAGGSNVHLIKQRLDLADTPSWTRETLRADVFTHEDCPEQYLSIISNFSLGQEQSDPVIVALAWSPSGLGLHRRSVLTVLTSNLLLAIWETNGAQCGWRRTCLFNHFLPPFDVDDSARNNTVLTNPVRRIRSVTWAYPFLHPTASKFTSHFLVIVEDHNVLFFYTVAKNAKHDYGHWSIKLLSSVHIRGGERAQQNSVTITSLQLRLFEQSPVYSVSITDWQTSPANGSAAGRDTRAAITCQSSYNRKPAVSFEVTIFGIATNTETFQINIATLIPLSVSTLTESRTWGQHGSCDTDIK